MGKGREDWLGPTHSHCLAGSGYARQSQSPLPLDTQGNSSSEKGPDPPKVSRVSEFRPPGFLAQEPPQHPASFDLLDCPRYLDVLGHHADVPAGGQEAVDGAGQVDPEPLAKEISS